jgi:arginyl-tRNA synthetase
MDILTILSTKTAEALKQLYSVDIETINFEATNPTFEGDFTLVVFPFVRISKKKPEETAEEIGNYLVNNVTQITRFNVVKGFLNLVIDDSFWIDYFKTINGTSLIKNTVNTNAPRILVEYSSPNTNKPLHLGHVRNNLLGYAVAEILKAAGNKVTW